jgi:Skp family chaperone for outer membrane proteins
MKNFLLRSLVPAVAGACLLSLAAQAASPAPPMPKIVVIDRNAILSNSKVGQDILRQLKADRAQDEKDLNGQAESLRAQIKSYQQQSAILSATLRAQKGQELEGRQRALQEQAQTKDALLQGGLYKARLDVAQAVGPILKQVMAAHGANLVLDKAVVIDSSLNIDITPEVINALNQKMTTLKVQLVPPPAGMVAAPQ